ncbi:aspartate-semialdehyde dehydrogenase [Thiobacter aerophilum]|uniref:aspartate-semialdehyde dehydrogenase n=1 Tax=Thiobacter aerophilum TaxID=3121275 RepID=A0ABV0EJG9_9BURK
MKYDICVVGPRTLVGETLLEILEERAFPVNELYLLDAGEAVGETVVFQGSDYGVGDIAEFDFAKVKLAFFCGDASLALEHAPRAAAQGCLVIDDSDAFRREPDVPLVVPEVNPEALTTRPARGIITSPGTCATLLALTLQPLAQAVGLEAVRVVTLQSVSGTGRAAVEELARQSMDLFNQNALVCEVFPKQIAFNLLPQIGSQDQTGYTTEESKLMEETRRLMRLPDLVMDATCVRVPVFYGHALVAQVRTRRGLTRATAQRLFEAAPGIVLYDRPEAGGCPTPVVEAATHDPVFVGRVRLSAAENAKGITYWAVVDNMRKGAALNCVQIAEKLLQTRQHSPLM